MTAAQPSHNGAPGVEIRVRGPLGPTLREAFPTFTIRHDGSDALLSATIADQAALYGVLHKIEAFGLERIEVRRRPPLAENELRDHLLRPAGPHTHR